MVQCLRPFSCKTLYCYCQQKHYCVSVMDMIIREWEPGRRHDCKGCSIFLDFGELWILPLVGNCVCLHQALDKITAGLKWSLGECWGRGALGKQTSPEWGSWPLLTRKWHFFHTVTVTLNRHCNPSVCLCDGIYLLFQLFPSCMVFSGEDNILSMTMNSS